MTYLIMLSYGISKKTKTMVVTRNEGIQAKLEHEGEYLDQVKDFKFLGSYTQVC